VCGNYRLCPACRLHNVHVGSCLAGSALCLEVTHSTAAQYAVATRRFVCVKFCYCAPVKTVTFGRTISFKQGLPCVLPYFGNYVNLVQRTCFSCWKLNYFRVREQITISVRNILPSFTCTFYSCSFTVTLYHFRHDHPVSDRSCRTVDLI